MNNSSSDSKFKVLVNMPQEIMRDKVQGLLQMCEVEFIIGNRKDFDHRQVNSSVGSLLKENINYKIEESEMELALSSLNAAVNYMSIRQSN